LSVPVGRGLAINAAFDIIDCKEDMASITIRNLDDALKARLRLRAAHHGRSMEEEARDVLRAALASDGESTSADLLEAIRRRFARVGFIELAIPAREPMPEPPDFGR
jgi:antitoxin FitA